ncbi:MAG: hypothetical protein ACI8XO_003404 [Verrucomicrobiales bacterium]|jgi:hypothetical protein
MRVWPILGSGVRLSFLTIRVNGIEADYTTTKIYFDEIGNETSALSIVLDPDESQAIAPPSYPAR